MYAWVLQESRSRERVGSLFSLPVNKHSLDGSTTKVNSGLAKVSSLLDLISYTPTETINSSFLFYNIMFPAMHAKHFCPVSSINAFTTIIIEET